MSVLRRGAVVAACALACASAVACGQVLGLDGIEYQPGEEGAPDATDGTANPTPDAAAGDAPSADAAAPPNDGAPPPKPATLATGPGPVKGVAVDDARVYWVTDGPDASVLSVLKDGGGAVTLATNQASPLDIAVSGSNVVWSVAQTAGPQRCLAMIVSAPDAGDPTPSCVTKGPNVTVRMALGGPGIVLLAQGTGPDANKESVGFAPLDAGAFTSTPTQGASSAITGTANLALLGNANGPRIDELTLPGLTFGASACTLNCGGGTVVDMITDVGAANVLWITSGGGVRSAPIAVSGGVGTLLATFGSPQRMARDASHVYVTNDTSVLAVPLGTDAGAPFPLSVSERGAFGIAVDQDAVYWGDERGNIRRIDAP